jgi:hypothetical protein
MVLVTTAGLSPPGRAMTRGKAVSKKLKFSRKKKPAKRKGANIDFNFGANVGKKRGGRGGGS